MMVRVIDHEVRKREVLARIVEDYIKTVSAVSSEDICRHFDCSSATIRNVMCELEEEGHLAHMHSSGGRIPTDKGYRYYVDVLLFQMQLFEEEKGRITQEYSQQISKLEDLLEKTSEVLSAFTHCTGIVSTINSRNKIYYNGMSFMAAHPEFSNIEKIRSILKLLDEKKRLLEIINKDLEKKISIYIGHELACEEIANCSLIASTYDLANVPFGRIAVLGPRGMNYSQIIPTLEYVSELVTRALEDL